MRKGCQKLKAKIQELTFIYWWDCHAGNVGCRNGDETLLCIDTGLGISKQKRIEIPELA